MRTTLEIIRQVRVHFPEKYQEKISAIEQSAAYAAPEMKSFWLSHFVGLFNEVIKEPKEDWEYKAIAALTTKSEEEVRAQFGLKVCTDSTE